MVRPAALTYCAHPSTTKLDPVIGKPTYEYALHQRAEKGPCGPSGTLFVPETNPAKRLLRGRGLYVYGVLYVGAFWTLTYKMFH